MSKQRPTIKGKGADLFLANPEKTQFAKPEKRSKQAIIQGKISVYLPQGLIDMLDNIWLDLRRNHRKLRKSDIVRLALDELFRDYDKKHQDSMLVEHFNAKTV